MKVIITGGTGFLGLRLARRILERGSLPGPDGRARPVDQIVLFDNQIPSDLAITDWRMVPVQGDIADRAMLEKLIDRPDIAVFHLASVVSAGAEQDFDLAMRVNLDGHRSILEALRAVGSCPRYVFTSSLAVYGGEDARGEVNDRTHQSPQTTYGITKAIGELLVNDYTRKGFIDGRSARLGMVIVRPGKANKAASSFASAVLREPLSGVDYVLPVPTATKVAVAGYRSVVDGLLALHDLDGARLGHDRALNLPTLSVSVAEMIDSLQRVGKDRKLGTIRVEP
ncbi:MAG TPA: NAD-dependent epimerase/dehydratase family protein, partial [Povalibacter sp.]|nr:NAD-dependent epimerase/dehydratase family protein [Povalibacter sp.]